MDKDALAGVCPRLGGIFYCFNQLSALLKVMDNGFSAEASPHLYHCEAFFSGLRVRFQTIPGVSA